MQTSNASIKLDEKERRVKSLLKSYYHKEEEEVCEEEGTTTKTINNNNNNNNKKKGIEAAATVEIRIGIGKEEKNTNEEDQNIGSSNYESSLHSSGFISDEVTTTTKTILRKSNLDFVEEKEERKKTNRTNAQTLEMLKTKTIGELQNEYVNVSREIKRLESHGTHAVYENYSKFLSAAEFIENARPEIEQLARIESEKVEKATREAVEASKKLNEILDAKRFEIERARDVQNVLFNLKEALKAPETIRKLLFSSTTLEDGRIEKAVWIIAKTKPMLDRFSSLDDANDCKTDDVGAKSAPKMQQRKSAEIFLNARNEMTKISDTVANLLKKRVRSNLYYPSSLTKENKDESSDSLEILLDRVSSQSCAECLKLLGVPRDEVHEEFLYSEKYKMETILTNLESDIFSSSMQKKEGEEEANLVVTPPTADCRFKPKLAKVNDLFLNVFQKCARSYLEIFPEDGRQPLIDFGKVVFRRYFELLKAIFIDMESETRGLNSENLSSVRHMCAALGNMAADLASVHKLLPECALGDRVTEIVEKSVRRRIEYAHLRREIILSEKISQIEQLLANNLMSTMSSPTIVADAIEDFLNSHESTANDIVADIRSFSEERPLLLQSWRDEFGRFSRASFATSHRALCARLLELGSIHKDNSCLPYFSSPTQGLPNSPYLLLRSSSSTNNGVITSSTTSSLIASVLLFIIANESYTLENGLAKIFPSHVMSEKGKRSSAYDERLLRALSMSCYRESFREFLMLCTQKLSDAIMVKCGNASVTEMFIETLEKIKEDVRNIEASPSLVAMLCAHSSNYESNIKTKDSRFSGVDEHDFDIFQSSNKFSTALIVRRCVESALLNFQEYISNVHNFDEGESLRVQFEALRRELNREFFENEESHEICISSILKTLAHQQNVETSDAADLLRDIEQI